MTIKKIVELESKITDNKFNDDQKITLLIKLTLFLT